MSEADLKTYPTFNRVYYSSNNSGGDWWLTDEDWQNLEKAGWKVEWRAGTTNSLTGLPCDDGRWLGALATEAYRDGLSLDEAISEWESITGRYSAEEGCPCCGDPHYFYEMQVTATERGDE